MSTAVSEVAPLMTWLLVRTLPSEVSTMPVPAASVPCSPWSLTRSTLPAATWSSVRVVVPEPDDPADPDPDDPDDPEDPEDGDDAWVHGDDDCLGGEDDVD